MFVISRGDPIYPDESIKGDPISTLLEVSGEGDESEMLRWPDDKPWLADKDYKVGESIPIPIECFPTSWILELIRMR